MTYLCNILILIFPNRPLSLFVHIDFTFQLIMFISSSSSNLGVFTPSFMVGIKDHTLSLYFVVKLKISKVFLFYDTI